jgi:LPXTG-motif cell wall-anchored protein
MSQDIAWFFDEVKDTWKFLWGHDSQYVMAIGLAFLLLGGWFALRRS